MNIRPHDTINPDLLECFHSLRDATPAEGATRQAQRRLQQALARRAAPGRRWIGRFAAVAATACLVLALSLVLLPGDRNGQAFAQVQQHFQSFGTLSMRINQHAAGATQAIEVLMSQEGGVRVDVGDEVSVVVDPVSGEALTLLHSQRQALRFPVPQQDLPGMQEAMGWLQDIRDFQGEADRLAEPRMIEGTEAWGWALEIDGVSVLLWARADGLPLEMVVDSGGDALLDMRFSFDQPVDAGRLRIEFPPGYKVILRRD
jgi:hypothetical protein